MQLHAAPNTDAQHRQRLGDVVQLTQHLLRGMALQRILKPSDAERARLFALWKQLAGRELGAPARKGSGSANPRLASPPSAARSGARLARAAGLPQAPQAPRRTRRS